MKYNEILEEIYRAREEHARECGYDIHKIFEQLRGHRAPQGRRLGGRLSRSAPT